MMSRPSNIRAKDLKPGRKHLEIGITLALHHIIALQHLSETLFLYAKRPHRWINQNKSGIYLLI